MGRLLHERFYPRPNRGQHQFPAAHRWVGVRRIDQTRKGVSMTADEREPTGEEAPPRSAEEVSGKAGDHEFPTTGRGGDMTSDPESLARRPQEEGDDAEDTGKSGIPQGDEPRRAP